jgi:hypothetical protein
MSDDKKKPETMDDVVDIQGLAALLGVVPPGLLAGSPEQAAALSDDHEEIFVRYRAAPDEDWNVLGHCNSPTTWMALREIFMDQAQGRLEVETVALTPDQLESMPEVEIEFETDMLHVPAGMAMGLRGCVAVAIVAIPDLEDDQGPNSLQYAVTTALPDPSEWGLVLADLAQHLSNAYVHEGFSPLHVKTRIVEVMADEVKSPTGTQQYDELDSKGRPKGD